MLKPGCQVSVLVCSSLLPLVSEQFFNIDILSAADFLADGGWVKDIIASSAAVVFTFFRLASPAWDIDKLMFFPM